MRCQLSGFQPESWANQRVIILLKCWFAQTNKNYTTSDFVSFYKEHNWKLLSCISHNFTILYKAIKVLTKKPL